MTNTRLDRAYRDSRDAMLATLNDGFVDADGLRAMQTGMASMARNRTAFGAARYHELRALLDQVEQLPRAEPVFVRHPPVINHPPHAWHHSVPWPYRFKIDGPWLFVLGLFVGGFAFKPLWVIAAIIAFMRALVWCSFRFPMTTLFFVSFFGGLFGGGRRGRW